MFKKAVSFLVSVPGSIACIWLFMYLWQNVCNTPGLCLSPSIYIQQNHGSDSYGTSRHGLQVPGESCDEVISWHFSPPLLRLLEPFNKILLLWGWASDSNPAAATTVIMAGAYWGLTVCQQLWGEHFTWIISFNLLDNLRRFTQLVCVSDGAIRT